jgi:large subunit ribosomal protein L15
MQLNNIKRTHKRKIGNFVGRGGKRGKTSGRGTKGQKARAGRKIRPEFRDVIMRMPKLRGRGSNMFVSIERPTVEVKVQLLDKWFKDGDVVSPSTLYSAGLISKGELRFSKVKIIGGGEINKKLEIVNCLFTKSVKESIEKAGGNFKVATAEAPVVKEKTKEVKKVSKSKVKSK